MKIDFHVSGTERKNLVNAISSITGENAVYQFMPTCAYEIGNFTVTKDGALEFDDRIDSEEVETLLDQLAQQGFTAAETNMAEPEEPMGFTISVPLDKVNCGNLTRLLEAKGGLIRKALGVAELPIEISEEGLELIEFLSLDCTAAEGEWHSDSEIKIDKLGYVIRDGQKSKQFWDGTIRSEKQPRRLKIRNICGDETVWEV